MADLGFLPVVTRIMDKTPNTGQRMLFSATLDNGVDRLVKRYLHNEVMHSVDEATSHVDAMTHHVFEVADLDAKNALIEKLASGTGRRILFMRTKHHAKKLAKKLTDAGIPSVDLHGNLSQPQRDRNLAAFSDGSARVLVATDVAARGVHVDDVELVVHVDPPMEHKAYLHRSGRTARAGSAGDVATISLPSQRSDLKVILRKAAITVNTQQVTAESPSVIALVGDTAPYVKPAPREERQQQGGGGRSQGANAQRKRAARDGFGGGSGSASGSGSGSQGGRGRSQSSDAAAAGRPRRDRSGRPAADGAASGAPRTSAHGSSTRGAGSGQGGARGGSAKQPIRVGSVVRGTGAGAGSGSGPSRSAGSRRAQG